MRLEISGKAEEKGRYLVSLSVEVPFDWEDTIYIISIDYK